MQVLASHSVLLQKVVYVSSALYLYCPGVSPALRVQRWYLLQLELNTYWKQHVHDKSTTFQIPKLSV